MKLLRYRENNTIKPGILGDDKIIRDISSLVIDLTSETISQDTFNKISDYDISKLPIVNNEVSIAPCVGKVGKFVCIGLNYSDHAAEMSVSEPSEPIVFMKATSSICGPNDDIIIPKNSKKSDWEVELGVIIGKEAKYISVEESQEYIAGYCVINDLSEREFQLERLGQWSKGKSCDTFGPIGPYLVTKDEVPEPQRLNMWLEVNGQRMQNGSTSTMIFGVNFLISYLSQFMSLQPGDIISTGTPPGVGAGMKPPVFLKSGDSIKLGVEGIGEQNQKTISFNV